MRTEAPGMKNYEAGETERKWLARGNEVDLYRVDLEITRQALASPKLQALLAGKSIAKSFYVPGRLLNLVVK